MILCCFCFAFSCVNPQLSSFESLRNDYDANKKECGNIGGGSRAASNIDELHVLGRILISRSGKALFMYTEISKRFCYEAFVFSFQ